MGMKSTHNTDPMSIDSDGDSLGDGDEVNLYVRSNNTDSIDGLQMRGNSIMEQSEQYDSDGDGFRIVAN